MGSQIIASQCTRFPRRGLFKITLHLQTTLIIGNYTTVFGSFAKIFPYSRIMCACCRPAISYSSDAREIYFNSDEGQCKSAARQNAAPTLYVPNVQSVTLILYKTYACNNLS